ncbi:alpha/beta hydrolase [Marinimicrobium sp. ABcell2]|uniref:alpha/beta hydrolase n=1 Tax=Marinimicrobium sp. ABcell2 TaxID=3069751 RepID=UPI0027AE9496|nr:alpha/beta hydrolase [Marinimicrobium sp. ABcell2]MDQ2075757.1 alpha/beta hydrolase [Marinimicrobium sp. ABcell2]
MNVWRAILFVAGWLLVLASPPALAEHSIVHHKDIVWASPKDLDLTLDIAVPESDVKSKPVLVIIHGGGWLLNDNSIMSDLANSIAKRTDIITVNVNYRSLGDLDNTTTLNEMVEDVMGAMLWVKQHIHRYGGDADKIAITGDSAGGHLAAMVALAGRNLNSKGFEKGALGFKPTYLPEGLSAEQVAKEDRMRVQAVILSYAAFNFHDAAKGGFEQQSNPFWGWAGVEARGVFGDKVNVEDHPEYYQAVSPDQYLVSSETYALPPQFVLVGSLDRLTTPESAKDYVEQLKKLGQPVQFTIYDGKDHGFLDSGCNEHNNGCFDELSEPTVSDMVEFLNQVFEL